MITIVIHKDNAGFYKHIDDCPEPYYPEKMNSEGDDWVEINIEDESKTDFYYLSNTHQIALNHILMVGCEDEDGEFDYKLK